MVNIRQGLWAPAHLQEDPNYFIYFHITDAIWARNQVKFSQSLMKIYIFYRFKKKFEIDVFENLLIFLTKTQRKVNFWILLFYR